MFKHPLIKRSLATGLVVGAAAFPGAAQAQFAESAGDSLSSAAQVPVTGPQRGLSVLNSNVQQWFAKHGHFAAATALGPTDASSGGYDVAAAATPATPLGPTDASSGGYDFATGAAPKTAQPGSSFHWDDAGIGAGSAVVLLGASGLGVLAMRRRRPQGTLVS